MARVSPSRSAVSRRPAVLTAVLAAVMVFVAACSSAPDSAAPTGQAPSSVVSSSAAVSSTTSAEPAPSSTSQAPVTSAESPSSATAPSSSSAAAPPPVAAPAISGPILPASRPTVLEVPSIGVRSDLLDLGQNADGTVQVPDVDDPNSPAGWYNGSPTPGELGPSILLGHVDSRTLGPGVFYNLADLQPGAEIRVTREDGTVAIFQVDRVQSYSKVDFPTLTVYGNLDHAGLRLITCGGVFDAEAGSYESNIVAFAKLVGEA